MEKFLLLLFCVSVAMDMCEGSDWADSEILSEGPYYFTAFLTTTHEWKNVSVISISNKIPFKYTIVVPEGPHNLMVDIATAIDSGENIFSLCSVQVAALGDNLLGNMSTSITLLQTTSGLQSPYKEDSAQIVFGDIVNSGLFNDTAASSVEVVLDVIVVNSNTFTHGAEYYVNFTATLDNGVEILTENLLYNAIDTGNIWSSVPPIYNLTGPSTVILGDVTNWTVTANLRDAVNKLQVEAWISGDNTYPACNIYQTWAGTNYPCLDSRGSLLTRQSQSLMLEIPTVINTGFNDISITNPDDDITANVIVKLPTFVNSAETFLLNIDVYLDDKLAWSTSENINYVPGSLPTTNSDPVLQVSFLDGITTVTKGSGIILTIDITPAPGSVSEYSITILTETGVACISAVDVTAIGEQLCMANNLTATYSSTNSSDVINMVNAITDSSANTFANTSATERSFRVEVVVCVPIESTAFDGMSINLNVTVGYEITKTLTETVSFTIGAVDAPFVASGTVNMVNSTNITGYIASVVSVIQQVEMGPIREQFNLTVNVPVSGDSALATVIGITLVSAGTNFACISYNISEVQSVIISHTQKVQLTYDVGYIFNTGSSDRNGFVQALPADNTITFEVELQILDHVLNTDTSQIDVTTTLAGSVGTIASSQSYIDVAITGTEKPYLVFDVEMESFEFDKNAGDNITLSVNIYHDASSTAHAQNVIVHCMTPYYIEFGELNMIQNASITVDSSTPEFGIKFSISEIDFNDNVSFSFSIILDPARLLPYGVENLDTVVPVDMTYRGPVRGDRIDTGILHSDVTVFEFAFNTEQSNAIGMTTGLIEDCQITASSWLNTNKPSDARLDVGNGWKPAVMGTPFCGEEYIQINIGAPSWLTGIKLQSSTDSHTDIPTSYTLMYSDDGLSWLHVYTVGDSSPTVYFNIEQAVVNCNVTSNTTSQLVERSYVVNTDTGTIFVCGPSSVDGPVYCSRSDEAGDSWHEVDNTISNVIGTITNTTIVIGLSHDGISHVVSFDDGITWEVILASKVTNYQSQPGYISSIEFPNEDTRGRTFDSIYSAYGIDGLGFSLTGCTDGIAVKQTGGGWITKAWWGTAEASTMT